MIGLGSKVRDRITGFEGVVVSRHEYIYGCVRVGVQGLFHKDGLPPDPQMFDEAGLELLKPPADEIMADQSGGPAVAPSKRLVPRR